MEIITSTQNPKIKQAVKLQDAKERKESGLIIVEGRKEISLALKAEIEIETLFYCAQLAGEDNALLLLLDRKKIINVTPEVFKKIAYRENPDGFLAVAQAKEIKLEQIKLSKKPLIIVLEAVEKPGNLGAILRSADAAKADAVIVSDPKTDIFNPNVIRASLGTVFTNQVAVSDFQELQGWLKANNIRIFAATPHTKTAYTKADYSGPSAILIGTEHDGLSEKWIEAADEKIKIPMKGQIDSLNASVSLAIVLFEAIRQRNE
ncbi:MAG: RNA methyltransferase [Patescibacteria group bacterium]